ncbi:MAG TPA: DUF5996 family protein [Caulobacteraceae bacterium]|jgi:hypothetical protein
MAPTSTAARDFIWPALPLARWRDTCETLHLWTQVVGKARLVQTPWLNHAWHVTLYVSARGLTTGPVPHGNDVFELELDLISHQLVARTSQGGRREFALDAMSVAAFHVQVTATLAELGTPVEIPGGPNEMETAVPFDQDQAPRVYDRDYAHRYWRVLLQADRLFKQYRTSFLGKSSPSHLFWGGFDLAITRFSGRKAPKHAVGFPHMPDAVVLDAYSHEVMSVGFWPGGGPVDDAAFYAYAYPEPEGFREAKIAAPAYYATELGEWVLPYEKVLEADDPDAMVLEFLDSAYAAAADLAKWDRAALDCGPGQPRVIRPT